MTRVSVIIPTYNRLPRLKQVLAALERQQDPPSEMQIVVVSDGSTDGTHDYLQTLNGPLHITTVIQHNQGPAAARNQGIAHARGEIVLFIDDDVVPTATLVAEHLRIHDQQANAVVMGPMLTPDDFHLSPWVAWEQAMLLKQYRAMEHKEWEPTARQFYTGNTSLARRHLLAAGGFDERFRRAEDIELAYRLQRCGVRFIFQPLAIGYHYAERSFSSWNAIPYAYGRNDMIFARERESWIMGVMQSEFQERNLFTRSLVRMCLGRPLPGRLAQAGLQWIGNLSYRIGIRRLSRAAYSAIFNLRYYQGAADELGGRARLLDLLFSAAPQALQIDHQ